MNFHSDDVFIKTNCYHYFHKNCLHSYISSSVKQMEEEKLQFKRDNPNAVNFPEQKVIELSILLFEELPLFKNALSVCVCVCGGGGFKPQNFLQSRFIKP